MGDPKEKIRYVDESLMINLGRPRSALDVAGENLSVFRMASLPHSLLRDENVRIEKDDDSEVAGLVSRRKKLIEASRSEPLGSTSLESRQQNASILRNEIKGDTLLRIMTEDQVLYNNRVLTLSEKGDLKELMKVVEGGKQAIKWESCKGLNDYTPLHHACNRGHILVASAVLKASPSMLHAMTITDESPLHLAVVGKELLLVEQLLDRGADVEAQTKDGETPLMYACRKGQAAMIRLLLARGARVSTRDKYGDTARDYCDELAGLTRWIDLQVVQEEEGGKKEGTDDPVEKPGPVPPAALPVMALVHTMSFLSVMDIGRCAVVCGAWHRACEEEAVWKSKGLRRWQLCLAKSSVERMGAPSLAGPLRPKSK